MASQGVLVVKNPPANAGDARDMGLIPGLGRSPGVGNGNPLQYSGLENPTEVKLPTSAGSLKKQESSRKTSISALLTIPKPLTVWITINSGKF